MKYNVFGNITTKKTNISTPLSTTRHKLLSAIQRCLLYGKCSIITLMSTFGNLYILNFHTENLSPSQADLPSTPKSLPTTTSSPLPLIYVISDKCIPYLPRLNYPEKYYAFITRVIIQKYKDDGDRTAFLFFFFF